MKKLMGATASPSPRSVEDKAMYLTYAPVAPVGLKLILR